MIGRLQRNAQIRIESSGDDQISKNVALDQFVRLHAPIDWCYLDYRRHVTELIDVQLHRAELSRDLAAIMDRLILGLQNGSASENDASCSEITHRSRESPVQVSARIKQLIQAYCCQREVEWSNGISGVVSVMKSPRVSTFESLITSTEVSTWFPGIRT